MGRVKKILGWFQGVIFVQTGRRGKGLSRQPCIFFTEPRGADHDVRWYVQRWPTPRHWSLWEIQTASATLNALWERDESGKHIRKTHLQWR